MYVGKQVQCCWFLCTGRHLQCIKGFACRFYHNSHLDIEREGLTAYCRSSSGDSVDFGTILCNVPVWLFSDWCVMILAHGCWVSIQSIVGIIRGGNCSLYGPLGYWMASVLSVGIYASGIFVPLFSLHQLIIIKRHLYILHYLYLYCIKQITVFQWVRCNQSNLEYMYREYYMYNVIQWCKYVHLQWNGDERN